MAGADGGGFSIGGTPHCSHTGLSLIALHLRAVLTVVNETQTGAAAQKHADSHT